MLLPDTAKHHPLRDSMGTRAQAWAQLEDEELGEKLSGIRSLMLLRKGALEEVIRKASEAMKNAEVGQTHCSLSHFSSLFKRLCTGVPSAPWPVKNGTSYVQNASLSP